MFINLLSMFAHQDAENALIALLQEPILIQDDESFDAPSLYDVEISYRSQALKALSIRASLGAQNAIRLAATSNSNPDVRRSAIRVISFNRSDSFRETLRNELQPGDEFHLDRPHVLEQDFQTKYDAYVAEYATN